MGLSRIKNNRIKAKKGGIKKNNHCFNKKKEKNLPEQSPAKNDLKKTW